MGVHVPGGISSNLCLLCHQVSLRQRELEIQRLRAARIARAAIRRRR